MELDLLRNVSILQNLSDEELAAFASLLRVRQVGRGDRILDEGTPVNAFSIVCSGVVHIRRLAQKRAAGEFGLLVQQRSGLAAARAFQWAEKISREAAKSAKTGSHLL